MDKLFFLSTDGAPVVSSDLNGLYGLLKREIKHLIASKCKAHKTALGAKDLAKYYPQIDFLNH